MALSRKIKEVTPRSFKRQESGLVQYGAGGAISGVGGIMSAIPTPWTQIGGAALSLIGGIVGNKEEEVAQRKVNQAQAVSDGKLGQSMVNNPFAQTFANGGQVGNKSFDTFKKEAEKNSSLQDRARLDYYNQRLDSALYKNDFNKYKGIKNNIFSMADRGAYADNTIKSGGFTNSLNENDIRAKLGTQYDDYVSIRTNPNYYTQPTAGTKDPNPLVYGMRNSFVAPIPQHQNTAGFVANMSWHPDTGYKMDADMSKRAMGGYVPGMQPNVEVEGGEVIQGKNKSIAEVKGPKHKDGGVKLFMENGGRVFSDKLIDPLTGKTFAEGAKRYM